MMRDVQLHWEEHGIKNLYFLIIVFYVNRSLSGFSFCTKVTDHVSEVISKSQKKNMILSLGAVEIVAIMIYCI